MSYDFTYDFSVTTSIGFAEGTVDVDYDVAGGELFINRFSNFKGKIYTTDGDVICDFVTQKHQELGNELYKTLYKDIVISAHYNFGG
jgi:hypothetical protein